MNGTILYRYSARGLALDEAAAAFAKSLAAASGQGTVAVTALLYAPASCGFAVYDGGRWKNAEGPMDASRVFEARLFSQSAELRWLNDPSIEAAHAAVIVSERQLPLLHQAEDSLAEARGRWQEHNLPVMRGPQQRYLLWGEGLGRYMGNGWSALAAARIGKLHVPLPGVGAQGRVQLVAQEYLQEREHGNMVVAEERLLGLETYRGDE